MSEHLSDLVLEEMLAGERREPIAWAHLQSCDLCWKRWQHLHVDEGLPIPIRGGPVRGGPVRGREAVPPANRPWAPWLATLVAAGVAAAASLALVTAPEEQTVLDLEAEVGQLRLEVQRLEQELANPAASGSSESASKRSAKNRSVSPEPPTMARDAGVESVSPEVLEIAVQEEITRRMQKKLETQTKRGLDDGFQRIGRIVDRFVQGGVISEDEGVEVEYLLQLEIEEGYALKADVVSGDLSSEDAMTAWKDLRTESDDALLDILSEEELERMRMALQRGEKK